MTKIAIFSIFLLVLASASTRAQQICTNVGVNLQNTNQDITVDNTVGGVTVAAQSALRCGLTLCNVAALNSGTDARCCPSSGPYSCTPTATVGYLIQAGKCYGFGPEGRQAWKCIRTGATSAPIDTTDSLP